jgi:hypothetical protein
MTSINRRDTKLADLPRQVQAAIRNCAPVGAGDLDEWIHQPLPALRGASIAQTLSSGAEDRELEVVALCAAIKSRF